MNIFGQTNLPSPFQSLAAKQPIPACSLQTLSGKNNRTFSHYDINDTFIAGFLADTSSHLIYQNISNRFHFIHLEAFNNAKGSISLENGNINQDTITALLAGAAGFPAVQSK